MTGHDINNLRNNGCTLDMSAVNAVSINLPSVKLFADRLGSKRTVKKQWQAAWLLRAVTCIDLTTLAGDDTSGNVERLCHKANKPIREDILKALKFDDESLIKCGAICVYPAQVKTAVETLKRIGAVNIQVAAVATGFPSGQYSLKTRLQEIEFAVAEGASEIDIVINREMALKADWEGLYGELKAMRQSCGTAHMKAILAIGELGSMTTVYKASMVAMMAGADFIKTSTGKEGVNAILPVGVVMCRAIREYYNKTGIMVGFKPAGGIRTAKECLVWLTLIKEELGNEWLNNKMFRIGASSLLGDIERQLFHYVYGRYAAASELPMA